MKQNAFTKSVDYFKENWIRSSLYQMISAVVITFFSGMLIILVRKKMETVTELRPVLQDTLAALEQNDLAVADASVEVLNSLHAVTQEIIILTAVFYNLQFV